MADPLADAGLGILAATGLAGLVAAMAWVDGCLAAARACRRSWMVVLAAWEQRRVAALRLASAATAASAPNSAGAELLRAAGRGRTLAQDDAVAGALNRLLAAGVEAPWAQRDWRYRRAHEALARAQGRLDAAVRFHDRRAAAWRQRRASWPARWLFRSPPQWPLLDLVPVAVLPPDAVLRMVQRP